MIRWLLIGAAALIAGWCSGFSVGLAKAEQQARATVLSIGDGDTIRVLQGQQRLTIRLACIDAPEMAQAPDGANARRYLQTRLRLGSSVTLRPQTVDRFGRTVAEVIGEVNLNLALVEDGMAFAYRKYLGQCDAREYVEAEFRASRSRYGVWRVPGGITRPWDFRGGRTAGRSASTAESNPGAGGFAAVGSAPLHAPRSCCGFCAAVVRPPRGAFLLAMGSSRFSEIATTQAHGSTLQLGPSAVLPAAERTCQLVFHGGELTDPQVDRFHLGRNAVFQNSAVADTSSPHFQDPRQLGNRDVHRPQGSNDRQLSEILLIKQSVSTCGAILGLEQALIAVITDRLHRQAGAPGYLADAQAGSRVC